MFQDVAFVDLSWFCPVLKYFQDSSGHKGWFRSADRRIFTPIQDKSRQIKTLKTSLFVLNSDFSPEIAQNGPDFLLVKLPGASHFIRIYPVLAIPDPMARPMATGTMKILWGPMFHISSYGTMPRPLNSSMSLVPLPKNNKELIEA